jgi:hypothetical protein
MEFYGLYVLGRGKYSREGGPEAPSRGHGTPEEYNLNGDLYLSMYRGRSQRPGFERISFAAQFFAASLPSDETSSSLFLPSCQHTTPLYCILPSCTLNPPVSFLPAHSTPLYPYLLSTQPPCILPSCSFTLPRSFLPAFSPLYPSSLSFLPTIYSPISVSL